MLKFYCPIIGKRIRKNCGTRDRRQARQILRECRERLINGAYVASGGAITKAEEDLHNAPRVLTAPHVDPEEKTWDAAFEHYRQQKRKRGLRPNSVRDLVSRLEIAGRIFDARRTGDGLAPGATLRECATLEALEYLQNQLLDGAEGVTRFARRISSTA